MTTLAPNFHLVKLPPAPAHGILPPEPAFADRRKEPASVETGIAFSDYNFMQTRRKKMTGKGRRLSAPSFAFNYAQQRELIVRFWEMRAGFKRPRKGSLKARLRYAERVLQHEVVPRKRAVLEKLCREFVTCQDPKRRRTLEIEIQGIDTFLRTAEQGPSLIVGIVYFYFCAGQDSVGTGASLGVKPVSVRQLTARLRAVWKRMQDGTDGKGRGPAKKALAGTAVTSVT